MRRILVVIEDEKLRQGLQLALRGSGLEAAGVASMAAAARALAGESYGAVVVRASGDTRATADLIAVLRGLRRDIFVIAMVGADAGEQGGLAALRAGAQDYWMAETEAGGADVSGLLAAVRKGEARAAAPPAGAAGGPSSLLAPRSSPSDGVPLAVASASSGGVRGIVGQSPRLKAVMAAVAKVAEYKTTVLVRGESGTGKELVARAVHQGSPRAGGPFVAVNCGAIPSGLLESELFGHDRGAFTGAIRDRAGLMEQASSGTLFLDEIGELSLAMQVNLLRVLQEDLVRRVGGSEDLPIDVRVVAATARDLEAEVAGGRFREDLFYRLNVVSLTLPPLRQRLDDLPLLIDFFIQRARQRVGVSIRGVTPAAMQRLVAYPWPGNIRELENTVERAAVMSEGEDIDVGSLPERILAHGGRMAPTEPVRELVAGGPGELSVKLASRRLEEELIRRALARTAGNRTRAAELLEISHRALLYKIKEYGIG
ncbi:MAG TPA: sigma 54-interacting transcriptional regulator [Polyangia bacterium]|jgi:two-component system response regulator AtoC|nr:sigma 54-interacting transcriptional regulator [Polyangia bacterium]